ncbi:PAS domain-containing protein [Spirosoma utsteinense]|uniref:histidine kinase n=1 Tax=Spirosoma utsteinense TaxID=2585773 RepID=A0ABR6W7P7_9BACT|nr:PAS domain-containing protein [Spirosoma utsteinense]MBC3785809.1 PAS domain S-box-containing protein [Spirosoma utsteinense]MBC3791981.1 PAS domain S-box-containing protein [Spirosoma utsteinense]
MINYMAQRAPALLQSILDASQQAVTVYQAERSPEGILIDLQLRMLNASAERLMGYSASEAVGKRIGKLLPHLVDTDLFDRYQQVIETGQSSHFEFEYTRPDRPGSCWCDVSAVPMEDSVVVTYNDITRNKANAAAARLVTVFEQAFNAALHGITVLEAIHDEQDQLTDFRFILINPAGLRMSGYTREYLLQRTIWEVYPATGINGLFAEYARVYQTGQPYTTQHYYPEYDIWRDVHITPVPGGIMLTYTDSTAHHKLVQTSQQQTALLHSLLDGSKQAILGFASVREAGGLISDFRCILQNKTSRQWTGRPDAEIIGQTLPAFFPQLHADGLLPHYVAVVDTGTPFQHEMEKDWGNGLGWYSFLVVKHTDGILLTVTDKTSERQAQLRLQEQALLLQSITDNTPAGLVLWEAVRDDTPERNVTDFRYRLSNLLNTYVTGHTAKDLLGNDLLASFPRFRGTPLETALRDTLRTGLTQRMLFTDYTDPPGGWYDAQFSPVGDKGTADLVLMTYMDVTHQHQTQLMQKQQADLFQLTLNAQPAGVILYKPVREPSTGDGPGPIIDFTIELVNEAEVRMTGLSVNELVGHRMLLRFPSPEGHAFFEQVRQVAQTGQPEKSVMAYFSDGIKGWFQTSLIPHLDQVLFTFLDVSELKYQQQTLEMANLDLKRSNENLRQFAYIASHDLQEPLRKIQSFGSILAASHQSSLDEAGQQLIKRMQTSAERMSMLIKDLLTYSRLPTHQAPSHRLPLADLVTQVLDDLALTIEETGACIEVGELPEVAGDRTQLELLLGNLLGNALKFRRPGEAPHIRVSARLLSAAALPAGIISPTSGTSRQYTEIVVADNGIGFDEKYLDRIFEVFQRLHNKKEYMGSGIGLSICRKVVQNHNGGIIASSEPGKGATFRIYLPLDKR